MILKQATVECNPMINRRTRRKAAVIYEDEIDEHVPYIEKLMIEGMRQATPHVKVKVETDIMRYWDKGAIPYSEYLVSRKIEDPEYVKKVKGTK